MNELLEELVPPFERTGDWDDVLRRSRVGMPRRVPRRLALVAAVVGAALVVGPALGVLLTRDSAVGLPKAADRRNVVVILRPLDGRVLAQAAPWKGHRGICYVILSRNAGCVRRTSRGVVVAKPPVVGFTFDPRVAGGTAVTFGGKTVPLRIDRFPKLGVTFFLARGRLPGFFKAVTLRAADGTVVARYRLRR